MKKVLYSMLISSLALYSSDSKKSFDVKIPVAEAQRKGIKNVDPEDRVVSFKKPEFITRFPELVGNKATTKIIESKKPMKLLSYDLLNNWKVAANLLVSTVNADATFETITNKNTGKDLIYYAAELRKEVSEFYNVCAIIIDQHPIYSYKKPLFRKKADASYDETQINAARKKIKDTAQQLDSMSRKIVKTHADIAGLSKYPTAGQQQVHGLATKFAETISTLVNNLEHEINAIP